jgi:hypothetical protein
VTRIIVIAKAPVPGRVKTRLCPPCTAEEAAAIAEAALVDTLLTATSVPGAHAVLALDGPIGPWLPRGVRVVRQRGNGLDERIAAAFADVKGPAVLIGMDTPQVTRELLAGAIRELETADAVLGPAMDGGWWTAGLRRSVPEAFVGVPMSSAQTGELQRMRFEALGLRVASLPALRDFDTFDDAVAVARAVPHTPFSRAVDAVASKVVGSRA